MPDYTNLSDRELLAKINQLVKKGKQYEAKNNYCLAIKCYQEANELRQAKHHVQLVDALTREQQNEMCNLLTMVFVLSDMCYDRSMALKSMGQKFGLLTVDISDQLNQCIKRLQEVVCTIDASGNLKLSEHFADMSDEIFDRVVPGLYNTITNIISKRLKFE